MNLRKWTWVLLMAFAVITVSCSDDDTVLAPTEIRTGFDQNQVSLNLSESVKLEPKFEAEGEPTYKWELNDEIVGDQMIYSFTPDAVGNYKLKFEVSNESGSQSIEYSIRVYGPYSKGVFIVNEGWFGHEPGSVNFWDRESDEIECKVYEKANPGKELGVTTQYACIAEGKLFLVSKDPDHLVVVNSETLLEEGRVSLNMGYTQARGFAYQDNLTGYLSSSDGIYKVDLAQFQMGEKVPEISGEVGKMIVLEGKLFALQSKELFVINISTLAIEKTISLENSATGMVTDKDGKLWVSASTQLVKVDPASLEVEATDLPNGYAVNKGWVWDAGCLTYSKQENALFFVEKGGWAARKVAKYDIKTKTVETICEIDSDYQIYGAGTFVDPISNKLYVTALKGFGQDAKYNRFYVYSLDGTLEKVLNYEHFYFAALCVTNE